MKAWLEALKRVLGDPVAVVLSASVGMLSLGGGYFYGTQAGAKECQRQELQAENTALKEVRQIEVKAASEISNKGVEFHEEKKRNSGASDAVVAQYGRMRVKSSCSNMPTIAGAGTAANGTGADERRGSSEVDFADLAEQITRLGLERDNAASKVNKLQETLIVYQSVCGIAKP